LSILSFRSQNILLFSSFIGGIFMMHSASWIDIFHFASFFAFVIGVSLNIQSCQLPPTATQPFFLKAKEQSRSAQRTQYGASGLIAYQQH
jgi:hypothetical protein